MCDVRVWVCGCVGVWCVGGVLVGWGGGERVVWQCFGVATGQSRRGVRTNVARSTVHNKLLGPTG